MNVIGLSAKMGCGKTTLADFILAKTNGVRRAFGDLVKEECSSYFGFPLEWCYSQEGKLRVIGVPGSSETITVREALQWYGTDYRRAEDPAYWVKALRREILKAHECCPDMTVVIDDVRFPDEAAMVLEHGLLFRIEPHPQWQPGPYAGHASETALDDFDRFTAVYKPPFGLKALKAVAVDILRHTNGKE